MMGSGSGDSRGVRRVRWHRLLPVLAAMMLALPVSSFVIDALDRAPADAATPSAAVAAHLLHDQDVDGIDDRLAGVGDASVLVRYDGPLGDRADQLDGIPGLRLVRHFELVDGSWFAATPEARLILAALPFVEFVEADVALTPQLDVTARSIGARDSRGGQQDDGIPISQYRGAWSGEPGRIQGVDGNGTLVALVDGGIDDIHPALDDLDDDPTTVDPKVVVKMHAWTYAALAASGAQGAVDPATTGASANFTTMPHATALAGAIAGTGDSAGTLDGENPFDRWAYAGAAPGARLADVNVFVGRDYECAVEDPVPVCAPPPPLTTGEPGSTVGLESRVIASAGLAVTGADMIAAYNQFHPEDPIHIAVFPLLDTTSCGEMDHGTTIERALDTLAQGNTTVIVSVGQNLDSVCAPANIERALAVGALDDQGTIHRGDDQVWGPTAVASGEGQAEMAKPELYAPGVRVTVPRTESSAATRASGLATSATQFNPAADYYTVSGSSVAAAVAAGHAALVHDAARRIGDNATANGTHLKEFMIQRLEVPEGSSADPAGFIDEVSRIPGEDPSESPPDGVHDDGNRTGWEEDGWGFGVLDSRRAVCSLVDCPMPWESVGTAIDPDAGLLFSGTNQETVRFGGSLVVNDALAGQLWKDRHGPAYYELLEPVGAGVRVHLDVFKEGEFTSVASDLTDDEGVFDIAYAIGGSLQPGIFDCRLRSVDVAPTDDRDGIRASATPAGTCIIIIVDQTQIALDVCEGRTGCDPTRPFVSFLGDPKVDILTGSAYLKEGDDNPLGFQEVTLHWPGAPTGMQTQTVVTAPNTGRADIRLPIDGRPGIFPLTVTYEPGPGESRTPAAAVVPIVVGVGASLDLQMVNRVPGEVIPADGEPHPMRLSGRLTNLVGTPIAGRDVTIKLSAAHLQDAADVASATTDGSGTFVVQFDAGARTAGSYSAYATFAGEKAFGTDDFVVLAASSARLPFTVISVPELSVKAPSVAVRGDEVVIEGGLDTHTGIPLFNRTIELEWLGGTNERYSVQTDRSGDFIFRHRVPFTEELGGAAIRVNYLGDQDALPAAWGADVAVRARTQLTVFEDQVTRGDAVRLQGALYDDTGRPLAGHPVELSWGPALVVKDDPQASTVRTNALGRFSYEHAVPREEPVGPVTARARYVGEDPFLLSAAQATIGVIAPTDLRLETEGRSTDGVATFTTSLLDDQQRPVTDPQRLDVFLSPPRGEDREAVTFLDTLDLSGALAPELVLRHAYDFASGRGLSDGARLTVSLDDGATWTPIDPRGGYDDQGVAALGGDPGWTGTSSGWFPEEIDLSDFEGEDDVRIRFRLATSALSNDVEWGIDALSVVDRADGGVVFADDFDGYGAKAPQPDQYWHLDGMVGGREAVSGQQRGVIGTNLDGTHPAGAEMAALSPRIVLAQEGQHFALLRYRLEPGDPADVATLALLRGPAEGGQRTVLDAYRAPGATNLPPTDDYRWMLFDIPPASNGEQVRFELNFISNELADGTGLQVDEFKIVQKAGVESLDIAQPGNRWAFSGFEPALITRDVDTYHARSGSTTYTGSELDMFSLADGPVVISTPVPVEVYGRSADRVTVFPEGILALGDHSGRDISAECRERRSREATAQCSLQTNITLASPVVAPAWDADMVGDNARVGIAAVGPVGEQVVVVEWQDVSLPGTPAPGTRFQARFHPDGDIEFRYANLFFADPNHDQGAAAAVGVAVPGQRSLQPLTHVPQLREDARIYLSRVVADLVDEDTSTQEPDDVVEFTAIRVAGGTYEASSVAEAMFAEGFDLSQAGAAYLVVEQLVDLGQGDSVIVEARPATTSAWRALPAVQGGESSNRGTLTADTQGGWDTVVYDMSSFVGSRTQVRFQILANGASEGLGLMVRDVRLVTSPQELGAVREESFEAYVDTTPGDDAWWTSRQIGRSGTQPPFAWATHEGRVAEELGSRYIAMGDGETPLEPEAEFVLVSPPVDLAAAQDPVLRYWQLLDLIDDKDAAVVEISTDRGLTFQPVRSPSTPFDGFSQLLGAPGWIGEQFGLVEHEFDLTPLATQNVRFRLEFAAGDSPAEARWIIDHLEVRDRLDPGRPYLVETGGFSDGRWGRSEAAWTTPTGMSGTEHVRKPLEPITVLEATGGATRHTIPLPLGTATGDLRASVLFRGIENSYGADIVHSNLLVEVATDLADLDVHNQVDGGPYLVRGAPLSVSGSVVGHDGRPVTDGLVQISLDGATIASATTDEAGRFLASGVSLAGTMRLGEHHLRIDFTGDPGRFILPASHERSIDVKGRSVLEVVDQVADGDRFDVTVRLTDHTGAPIPRIGVLVYIGDDGEPLQVITDGTGHATFTTKVPVDEESRLEYRVQSLGSDDHLGLEDSRSVLVPAAPDDSMPWWLVALVAVLVLAAIAVLVFVALRRRKRRLEVAAALAEEVDKVRYRLEVGDSVRQNIFEMYRSFLGILKGAGVAPRRSDTPSEVADALRSIVGPSHQDSVRTITALFEEARYSDRELLVADRAAAVRSLENLRSSLLGASEAQP